MKKELILVIILGLAVFLVGGGLYLSQIAKQQSAQQAGAKKQVVLPTVPPLPSGQFVSFGIVSDISGRKITFSYDKNVTVVNVANDAQIVSLVKPGQQEAVPFSNVKVGSFLYATSTVAKDGTLNAIKILLIPGTSANKK